MPLVLVRLECPCRDLRLDRRQGVADDHLVGHDEGEEQVPGRPGPMLAAACLSE